MKIKWLDLLGISRIQEAAGDARQSFTGTNADTEPSQLANERNIGTANQYGVGVDESNGAVVDVTANSTDVSGSQPALLFGVYVNTVIATEAVGLHDGTGGTELLTLPIGLAAGTFIPFPGIKFNTALFVEAASATGSITLCWRPQ